MTDTVTPALVLCGKSGESPATTITMSNPGFSCCSSFFACLPHPSTVMMIDLVSKEVVRGLGDVSRLCPCKAALWVQSRCGMPYALPPPFRRSRRVRCPCFLLAFQNIDRSWRPACHCEMGNFLMQANGCYTSKFFVTPTNGQAQPFGMSQEKIQYHSKVDVKLGIST